MSDGLSRDVSPFCDSCVRSIRRQIPPVAFQSLIVALVLSRLDYRNSVLYGLPASLMHRLLSVQNAAARLIFGIRRSEHITDALISLHWLRVPERISFKLVVLTYRAIHSTAPIHYMQSCFTRLADMTSRQRLRSSTSQRLAVPPVRLTTIGKRAFPVSGNNVRNNLPPHVTICTVSRDLQAASQDISIHKIIPGHSYLT